MAKEDKILTIPDDDLLLRRQAKELKIFTRGKFNRIRRLFDLMYANNGIGLAAPQVGWNTKLFIVNITGNMIDELVFINPVIIEKSDDTDVLEEGCLSVPDVTGLVERSKSIKICADDLNGYNFTIDTSGLLARCILHEYDHLFGTLFIDKMKND